MVTLLPVNVRYTALLKRYSSEINEMKQLVAKECELTTETPIHSRTLSESRARCRAHISRSGLKNHIRINQRQ